MAPPIAQSLGARRMSRRQVLGLGAAVGLTALVAGCSTPGVSSPNSRPTIEPIGSGETVTLKYWMFLSGLDPAIEAWNSSHPNIQVETVTVPSGSAGYPRLFAALAAGGGPDLAQIETTTLAEFALVNGLVDLRRYGADQYEDRYNATLWGQVNLADGIYGIPQDSGPVGFYYQPEILDSVGAEPPTTWDEWADVAAALRGRDVYLDTFGDTGAFAAFCQQAGATWFAIDGDGWVVDMVDDASLEVARFFDRALADDLLTRDIGYYSPAWFAAASDGKIASWMAASWADAVIQGVAGGEGKWRVAPMPRWSGGFGSTVIGGSTVAVPANSKHPAEALEFAAWLTSTREGIDLQVENAGIGWSPVDDYIGAARSEPSDFFGGQRYNSEVFLPAAKDQNQDWQWWPLVRQTTTDLGDRIRNSGKSIVDCLADSQAAMVTAFRRKGLTIREAQR